jgi:phosphate transport system substrate-binding protein
MHVRFARLQSMFVGLTLALGACVGPPTQGGDSLSGTIAISGAFALYPVMTVWTDEFAKLHPSVQFDVQAGGAGKGMTDTLAGAVDIGMISRGIRPEEEARGAFWVSVARDAVFPVVSSQNPILDALMVGGIEPAAFTKIFITGEVRTWGQLVGRPELTDEIHVYTRSDSCGAGEQWALFSGGKTQSDLQGIGINGEPALVDTVAKDPLGIGYSNLNSAYDSDSGEAVPGIAVAPIDVNADGKADPNEQYSVRDQAVMAIASGAYPSPPARFENLATRGKPEGVVRAFVIWILTDGQAYLDSAGYVPLTTEQQSESLAKIR